MLAAFVEDSVRCAIDPSPLGNTGGWSRLRRYWVAKSRGGGWFVQWFKAGWVFLNIVGFIVKELLHAQARLRSGCLGTGVRTDPILKALELSSSLSLVYA